MLYLWLQLSLSINFTDINECLVAALDIFAADLCEPSMFCVNVEGNYSCECLAGTLLVEGVCEAGKFSPCNKNELIFHKIISASVCQSSDC